MDIGKVLEKAFRYPWENRALWFYGVLIAIFSIGSLGMHYKPDNGDYTQIKSYLNSFDINWSFLGALIIIAIIIGVIGVIITSWSYAAIIRGVSELEKGKKITRKSIGKTEKRTVWNIIVLSVFIPLGIILALITIAVPVIAVIAILPDSINLITGVLVSVFSAIILIIAAFYFSVLWPLAPNVIVLEKKRAIESLIIVKDKLKGNFWISFLFLIVTSFIGGTGTILFIIPLFILGILTFVLWTKIIIVSLIFGTLTIAYIVFLIFVFGYFQAFVSTAWAVWWIDMDKQEGNSVKK